MLCRCTRGEFIVVPRQSPFTKWCVCRCTRGEFIVIPRQSPSTQRGLYSGSNFASRLLRRKVLATGVDFPRGFRLDVAAERPLRVALLEDAVAVLVFFLVAGVAG